jgi:hypothetical protein
MRADGWCDDDDNAISSDDLDVTKSRPRRLRSLRPGVDAAAAQT